jgi:hypothetical protein
MEPTPNDTPTTTTEPTGLVLSVAEVERTSFMLEYRANPNDAASLTTGTFHFKTRDELSLEQQLALGRNAAQLESIGQDMMRLDPAMVKGLAAAIRSSARDVLHDVPDHVFEQLNDGHLLALLEGFGAAAA